MFTDRPDTGTNSEVDCVTNDPSPSLPQGYHAGSRPFQLGRLDGPGGPSGATHVEVRINQVSEALPGLSLSTSPLVPPEHGFFSEPEVHPTSQGVPPWLLQVMTDASSTGWGIVLPQSQYAGRLYASLLRAHIVLKGMLTIFWALLLGSETLTSLDPYRLSGICTDPTQQLLAHDSAGPIISSNLATSVPQITVATPLLPPRQLQCTGGSIIQRRYHLHRVVHQRQRLHYPAPPCRVRAPDRPICNGPQLPLQDIHLAMSGSSRSGVRRIRPLLGQMANVVSIPTDSYDFEGFSEAQTDCLRARNLRLPIASRATLVPGSVQPRSEIIQSHSPFATARTGLPCGPNGSDASDRVHFIRVCFTAISPLIPSLPSSWPFLSAHLPPRPIRAIGLNFCLFLSEWA